MVLARTTCRCSRLLPVFLARREPDDIASSDLLDWPALALGKAAAGSHDQCLSQLVTALHAGDGTIMRV